MIQKGDFSGIIETDACDKEVGRVVRGSPDRPCPLPPPSAALH